MSRTAKSSVDMRRGRKRSRSNASVGDYFPPTHAQYGQPNAKRPTREESRRRIMCPLCESRFTAFRELIAHARERHASDKKQFAIRNQYLSGAEFKKWMSTKRYQLIGPVVLLNRQADFNDYRCSLLASDHPKRVGDCHMTCTAFLTTTTLSNGFVQTEYCTDHLGHDHPPQYSQDRASDSHINRAEESASKRSGQSQKTRSGLVELRSSSRIHDKTATTPMTAQLDKTTPVISAKQLISSGETVSTGSKRRQPQTLSSREPTDAVPSTPKATAITTKQTVNSAQPVSHSNNRSATSPCQQSRATDPGASIESWTPKKVVQEPSKKLVEEGISSQDSDCIEGLVLTDEDDEFVVESIVDKRTTNGVTKYRVKWQGFDLDNDDTWEPIANLGEASSLIAAFEESLAENKIAESDQGTNKPQEMEEPSGSAVHDENITQKKAYAVDLKTASDDAKERTTLAELNSRLEQSAPNKGVLSTVESEELTNSLTVLRDESVYGVQKGFSVQKMVGIWRGAQHEAIHAVVQYEDNSFERIPTDVLINFEPKKLLTFYETKLKVIS